MATVEISGEVYDRLARWATVQETTVEQLVEPVLRTMVTASGSDAGAPRKLSATDLKRLLETLARPLPNRGFLPEDFSREDIYYDHD